MKNFNDQMQFKNMPFLPIFDEESSLYRDHNKEKKQSVLAWK